ncbi:uncharacterized protein LOC130671155 [Microplitis mediator]|uniref:uncharacterized protein LOC130671155 n=1 Tax=Microplitis mediator TaxID=375433 RepID=UPI002554C298|nr:uncharacterized protein LOC130671155 [Microplitis mediator]
MVFFRRMTQLFALVKWVSGEDKDKYTVGIPTEWIINFNYEDFKNEKCNPAESYVIEWRKSKKMPAGGWECYDGLVTEVSSSIAVLEKKFSTYYNGIQSPKNINGSNEKQFSNKENDDLILPDDSTARASNLTFQQSNENVPNNSKSKKGNVRSSGDEYPSSDDSDQRSEKTPVHGMDNADVSRPRTLFGSRNDQNDVALQILAELKNMRNDIIQSQRQNQSDTDDENNPKMVEVGRRGSGIKITEEQWECAQSQGRCTAMAVVLLTAIVPMDTLLRSNLKGGKARISKDPNNPTQHQGLDPAILEAIKYTVRKKFKKNYDDTKINTALNVKMSSLRRKMKPRNENAQN